MKKYMQTTEVRIAGMQKQLEQEAAAAVQRQEALQKLEAEVSEAQKGRWSWRTAANRKAAAGCTPKRAAAITGMRSSVTKGRRPNFCRSVRSISRPAIISIILMS